MDQEMDSHMSSGLYKAAIAGNVVYLSSSDTESEKIPSLTHEGNNCLHIAVRFGHKEFVERVISVCPSLVYQKNKRGENPLHVAARAGHLHVVKLLTDSFQQLQPPQSSQRTENSARNRITTGEGVPSERSGTALTEKQEGETTIQNPEIITALTDSIPPRISQSQSNKSSAAAGDEIISESSLREAEEGERPSRPIWGMAQNQQYSTTPTDSIQPLRSSQNESTGDMVTGITSEWPSLPIWRTQNHDGSTALHEALRNNHEDVALHLLNLDIEHLVRVVNAKDESPLYLAAEAGFVRVLTEILTPGRRLSFAGPKGQTPLHAAVFYSASSAGSQKFINKKATKSIELLHKQNPELIRTRDSSGKTALFHAAQLNSLKIIRLLLELDASSAYICDNEGLPPLLVASSIGRPASVRAILDAYPSSIEFYDDTGRNALHLAVMNCDVFKFKRLLRMPEMMTLINEPDKEGNTPLHLATMGHRYDKVLALLSHKHVDLTAKNNNGHTAFDVCNLDWELSPRQTQIWRKLRSRKASRGRVHPLMRLPVFTPNYFSIRADATSTDLVQVVNTLSLVAALLATITFAAAFTLPGGYKVDGPNVGSPLLIHKLALKVFLLSDTISLFSSSSALLIFSNATTADKALLRNTIAIGRGFVFTALYAAMVAFISGLYAVIAVETKWLAILICIIFSNFYFVHNWCQHVVTTNTPFVPGLLKRQTTRQPTARE
ncbi:protein ACCELERATED CELL DEATH 6-like [Macadamia integrifolia]|uniref:protein ACCELERATED CELL DEATH 6-like n=1 Tax=Macadamia integrifolia TaxID=60698 RepID=UPI001C52A2D9|nr:protein ACCELERATED CELL DEATH 6-like [Macadamia integrifolia]